MAGAERQDANPHPHLVVVGSSAGGIDALSTLVSALPKDFPAPIVLAQHLDPARVSQLAEILSRHSPLPVKTVLATEPLDAGAIYVVPSGRDVEITGHSVTLGSAPHGRSQPSIDRLFATAAAVFGENLIAVILTGTGSDGADGARRVKEVGGTIIIQNPRTASHPGMPLSLPPSIVDIVADLSSMGRILYDLVTGGYPEAPPEEARRLQLLLEQVRARSGIDFAAYRLPTIRRRLQRRMHDTGTTTLDEYLRYLRRHPDEYRRLASSFLIKVTDFFRDAELFEYLRRELLPQVIADARLRDPHPKPRLRLWSAGCATGEEPYSLAILVAQLLGEELDDFEVRIFATDLDGEAVAFARRGVYPVSAVKDIPPGLLERYFTRLDNAYEIHKRVRSLVLFAQHDLGERAAFPRIDLIMCRNVLIYFTPELQRRALNLFAFALQQGGYLVLGKSETTQPLPDLFTVVQQRLKVFRREGGRVMIPPDGIGTPDLTAGEPRPGSRPDLVEAEVEVARAHARQLGPGQIRPGPMSQLQHVPVGIIFVQPRYAIQMVNAMARQLLGLHSPAVGEDLVHLVHRSLAGPLRDAIDAARTSGQGQRLLELASVPEEPGQARYLHVLASQLPAEAGGEAAGSIVLVVSDVTRSETERRQLVTEAEQERAEAQHVRRLLDESTETVRQLIQANRELATANEELRSANQELLVSQEEAQAAMEEIETLNEEQQASNEELETLNEELQATVEELNATNEDLQAQAHVLHDQAAELERQRRESEAERQRLHDVLQQAPLAIALVRGPEHIFELVNPPAARLFGRPEAELLEQPLADVLPELARTGFVERLRRVYASGEPAFDAAVPIRLAATQAGEERDFFWDIAYQPLRNADGQVDAVLVQVADRTEEIVARRRVGELADAEQAERRLRTLQEEFLALAGHELRTPLTALQGALQMLVRGLDGSQARERVQRWVDLSLQQIRLLDVLVRDLSDMIRMQSGKFTVEREPFDLTDLVRDTVELAQSLSGEPPIQVHLPHGPAAVRGDARRLQQVLLNLLNNATSHAPGSPRVDVQLRRDGKQAVLSVRDYGPGIPESERERIFSRFYQVERQAENRQPGLGLGLFIARQIVEAHGGSIQAQNPDGGGTSLIVRLPLASEGDKKHART